MTTQEAIKVLENSGFSVEETIDVKNSVSKKGLIVKVGNTSPIIYEDVYSGLSTENELLDFVDYAVSSIPKYDTGKFFTKSFFLKNSIACIQKSGDESIVKRPFLDLEEYIRIVVGNDGSFQSFKVLPAHLAELEISEDELFDIAEKNVHRNVKIQFLTDVIQQMVPDLKSDIKDAIDVPVLIVSAKSELYGGATIMFNDIFQYICGCYDMESLVILPSSINEILVVLGADASTKEYYDDIVRGVNREYVRGEDFLADHCYVYRKETDDYIY